MIVARGHAVSFELSDGRVVHGPRGSELLHDETGRDIPADIVLVMRFEHTGKPLDGKLPKHVQQHFGQYQPKDGRGELPTLRLSSWQEVGRVKTIEYTRRGELHHGQKSHDKTHEFRRMPVLYRRGDAMLLKLGGGQRWDWRGVDG